MTVWVFFPPIHVFYIDTTVQMCYFGSPGDETLLLLVKTIFFNRLYSDTETHPCSYTPIYSEMCASLQKPPNGHNIIAVMTY